MLRAGALGQPEHVDRAVHAGLGRLHRVVLVVDRRGRAGEVVDLVDLDVERKGDVVAQQLERAGGRAGARCCGARPVKKLSTQSTSCPPASRRSHRWEPRKPAPPVTSTRVGLRLQPVHASVSRTVQFCPRYGREPRKSSGHRGGRSTASPGRASSSAPAIATNRYPAEVHRFGQGWAHAPSRRGVISNETQAGALQVKEGDRRSQAQLRSGLLVPGGPRPRHHSGAATSQTTPACRAIAASQASSPRKRALLHDAPRKGGGDGAGAPLRHKPANSASREAA